MNQEIPVYAKGFGYGPGNYLTLLIILAKWLIFVNIHVRSMCMKFQWIRIKTSCANLEEVLVVTKKKKCIFYENDCLDLKIFIYLFIYNICIAAHLLLSSGQLSKWCLAQNWKPSLFVKWAPAKSFNFFCCFFSSLPNVLVLGQLIFRISVWERRMGLYGTYEPMRISHCISRVQLNPWESHSLYSSFAISSASQGPAQINLLLLIYRG